MPKKPTAGQPPAAPEPVDAPEAPAKRARGRPLESAAGPVRPANITLDEESRAIAAELHRNLSVAVRLALRAWKDSQGTS